MAAEKDYCVRISYVKHTKNTSIIHMVFGPKAPVYLRSNEATDYYCSVRNTDVPCNSFILDIWNEPKPKGEGRAKIASRSLTANLARQVDVNILKPFIGEYNNMTNLFFSSNKDDHSEESKIGHVASYMISKADRMNFTNNYSVRIGSGVEEEVEELSADDKVRKEYKDGAFKPVATICKPLTKAGDDIIMSVNDIIREQIDECSKRIRELQRSITELEYRKRSLEAASRALVKEV